MFTPQHPRCPSWRAGAALRVGLALLICCVHAGAQTTPATDAERNPAQVMLFHQHAEDFKGGRQLAVTVYVSAFNWNGLSAMGLYETVPEGWTYGGARAVAGTMPSVTPRNGDSGVLQFLWIEQSTAPITFQYVLNIPPRESGTRVLSGQVEYRQGEGALTSNVAFSQVAGVADALPVVTLRGAAALKIALNDGFSDPGATASDAEDGDLSTKVQVAGTVNPDEPGTYIMTYGVADSVGNQSVPVSRQVTVSDTPSEAGGGRPDSEKSDQGGGVGTAGGAEPIPPGPLAKTAPEQAPSFTRIKIPDITLHENAGSFEVPVKDGEGTVDGQGGAGADRGGLNGTDAFRTARDAGGMLAPDRQDSDGAPDGAADTDSGDLEAAAAQSPLVLAVVALLMGAALIVLWRQSRKSTRRNQKN